MARRQNVRRYRPSLVAFDALEQRRLLTGILAPTAVPGEDVVAVIHSDSGPTFTYRDSTDRSSTPAEPAPLADPRVVSVGPVPATAHAGGILTLSADFGDPAAMAWFALSADDIAGNEDDIRLVGRERFLGEASLGPAGYQIPASVAPGTYRLVVSVVTAGLPDADPSNNAVVGASIEVAAPSAVPDLAISDFVVTPQADIEVGNGVYAPVTVLAQGSVPAGTRMKVFLSADQTLSSDDVLVATSESSPLGSLAFSPLVFLRVPAGLAPGQYHPIAVVDADNTVAESDESNNVYVAGPVNVHASADGSAYVPRYLSFYDDGHSGDVYAAGDTIYFHLGLGGFDDYYHVPASFYLSADGIAGNEDDIFITSGDVTYYPILREGYTIAAGSLPVDLTAGTYHLVAVAQNGSPHLSHRTITVVPAAAGAEVTSALGGGIRRVTPGTPARAALKLKHAGDYGVRLYLSEDAMLSSGDKLFSKQVIRASRPSDLAVSYTLPRGTKLGTRYLIVVADPAGSTSSGARSLASKGRVQSVQAINVVAPRLAGSIVGARAVGSSTRVTLRIENTGNARYQGPATIKILSEDSGDVLGAVVKKLSLKPGQSRTLTVLVPGAGEGVVVRVG